MNMNDETDTPTEETQGRDKGGNAIAKAVARVMWIQKWRAANPDSDIEARRAAWKDARAEETKAARKLIKSLENSGITMTLVETERKKGKRAEASEEDDLEHLD